MPGMGGMPGMAGAAGMGRLMGQGGQGFNQLLAVKKDLGTGWVDLTKISENTNLKLAEQVRPLRMAIIAASFPYKAQLEEFKEKLRLHSVDEVLAETSRETDGDGQTLPNFRFLGVNVERREVDANGKVLKPYQPLDLAESYRLFLILTGSRFEPDDPKLEPIKFRGLVMPRLLSMHKERESAGGTTGGIGQSGMMGPTPPRPGGIGGLPGLGGAGDMRKGGPAGGMPRGPGGFGAPATGVVHEDTYPKVEVEVENIAKTLKALEGKDPQQVAHIPSRFGGQKFDPFNPDSGNQATGAPGPEGPTGIRPPMPPGMGKGGAGPDGLVGPGTANPESDTPDHCLVRLIDLTIEPGKIYQYRIQVRMGNPNYHRPDVASPAYAADKELKSERWFEIPQRVVVPPELVYYAVDQKTLESNYKGPHQYESLDHARQVVLQAHKWLETVPTRDNLKDPLLVGEWAVAERLPVFRGEYIGRKERVEFPFWKATQEDYVVASDSSTKTRHPGIDVSFGYDRPDGREAVLVDFEGGKQEYERVVSKIDDQVSTRKVNDSDAMEIVILTPDGRLLSRDGARDANDSVRTDRLKKVRDRLKEIKDKAQGNPAGGNGRSPFGGGGGDGRP
jgi:hypothetical protein